MSMEILIRSKNATMSYKGIRDLREDADLTRTEIAKIIHMHKTAYIRYESGEREIPLNIAKLLARYRNVSLDYLAVLSENKK